MRKPANEIPNYLKYASYIIAHNATPSEAAQAYGVTTKQVRDDVNHCLKKNYSGLFNHVKKIENDRKVQ